MKKPDITIITVNYNAKDDIIRSIETLYDAIKIDLVRYFVVDNSDDAVLEELIEKHYPEVRYFHGHGNIGFGRGCNIGFEHTETPYSLLLNPDALLKMTDLNKMLSFMKENTKIAFLGPCIHEPGGTYQHAGGLPTPTGVLKEITGLGIRHKSRKTIFPGCEPFQTDWLSGAIILIRMKALDEVGVFDPRYFLYFEETDLCRRLIAAGWEIWVTGKAEGFHQNAGSAISTKRLMYADCIAEHYFQSRFYYMVKHYGWLIATITDFVEYIFTPARLLYASLRNKNSDKYLTRLRSPLLSLPKRRV